MRSHLLASAASCALLLSCSSESPAPQYFGGGGSEGNPPITNLGPPRLLGSGRHVDKVDLLLMIDNSSAMADKQAILAESVPFLLRRLVSPRCLDAERRFVEGPAGGSCPESRAGQQPARRARGRSVALDQSPAAHGRCAERQFADGQ
jgi:hypothetical protein